MMNMQSAKMLWLSLLSISLVSAILPSETNYKGANAPLVEHEQLRLPRMLRGDKLSKKKPKPGGKSIAGNETEVEEVVQEDDETEGFESVAVIEDFPDPNSTLTFMELSNMTLAATNMTSTSIVDDAILNETALDETVSDEQLEEESFYSTNVALVTLENSAPKGLPTITFAITADADIDEIDTSELSSLLSDYLLEQLTDKFPDSLLLQVDLDVEYKYKPEKEKVDGVGFERDKEDSLHIFTATGGVYIQKTSTVIPTENQVFAKTRDSVSEGDAEAAILSLLQENEDASLQEAKTFSISELKPREPSPLVEESSSIPRTIDAFIGLTAVLALLAGAYVARDRAIAVAEDHDSEGSSDDEESLYDKEEDGEDAETQPPTPPSTPPSTPSTTSKTKPSPRLITLSDFNIIDELSHLGDENSTVEGRNMHNNIQPQASILRSSTAQTRKPIKDEKSVASTQLIALSDFNIIDEFMCMRQEPTTEKSRHVKFDVDNETNTTSGETSMKIFAPCTGPIELADGVRIDQDDMKSEKSSKTNRSSGSGMGIFDCGDFGIESESSEEDYRSESTSYFSEHSELTY